MGSVIDQSHGLAASELMDLSKRNLVEVVLAQAGQLRLLQRAEALAELVIAQALEVLQQPEVMAGDMEATIRKAAEILRGTREGD